MPQMATARHALVIGESLVDIVTDPTGRQETHPGGSPMNVAVGLARLEVDTTLATHIADDGPGELVRAHVERSGVSLSLLGPETASTSTAHAVLDDDGAAEYTFDVTWAPESLDLGRPDLIHTGSLATSLDPGADVVEETLRGTPEGTVVSFDPNVRPSLAPARGVLRERVERIASLAHVVKMSDEDAAWLHPELSVEDLVAHYAGLSGGVFVLTRGAAGCTIGTRRWQETLPAPAVDVVDTIGAGDAFMSGLLYALLEADLTGPLTRGEPDQQGLRACARTALRSAAVAVSRAGANPPGPRELLLT